MFRRWLRTLGDRHDDRRARRRREALGRRRWVVSWQRRDDGSWLARVSCPHFPETVERFGASRCEAVRRAERSLSDLVPSPADV